MIHKKDYYGYVYIWFNKIKKKFYIGSHHGAVEDSYIGSGTYFIKAYNKNPTHFRMKVITYNTTSDDYKDTQKLEQHYLNLIKPHKLKTCYYNLKLYASGGLGDVNSGLLWYKDPNDDSKRGFFVKDNAPEGWVRGRGISTCLGRLWYHNPDNPTDRGRFELNADIPINWKRGSGYFANSGKKWYHNPNDPSARGFFSEYNDIPTNWILGNGNSHRLGKKWYSSPDTTESKLFTIDSVPEGWILGTSRTNSGKKWYRNPKSTERGIFCVGAEPTGWILGRCAKPK